MQERFKHGEGVPSELAIIVGRGRHVQPGGPKLKDAVQQLLQQQLHMNLDQVSALYIEAQIHFDRSIFKRCSVEVRSLHAVSALSA